MSKEVDVSARSRLLKGFVLTFVPFHLIGIFLPINILWFTLLWLICAPLAAGMSEGIGERSANLLYGLGHRRLHPKQRLEGELDKIRYSKHKKDFDKALGQVNEVLAKEPEFPEALFLKAQILWEGYGYPEAAKGYLRKVLGLVKEGEPMHRWALGYHEQVGRL